MLTDEFKLNIGVVPGYWHQNRGAKSLEKIIQVWRDAANKVWSSHGLYIGAVIHETLTVYRSEWGCPESGEKTFQMTGLRNPEFCKDPVLWKQCVEKVCELVKLELSQTTAYLSFTEIEFEYMR